MGYGDKQSSQVGCLFSLLIFLPVTLCIFLIDAISGGGCEGREQSCTPDHAPMWIGLLIVAITALAAASLFNRLLRLCREWWQRQKGS